MSVHKKNSTDTKISTTESSVTNTSTEDKDCISILTGTRSKQNRLEKKSRKFYSSRGLKPVKGITKILIKKSKHGYFSIVNVDVYRDSASKTYVIFGDLKFDDGTSNMMENLNPMSGLDIPADPVECCNDMDSNEPVIEEIEKVEESETGISEDDIKLVMRQAYCTREMAIKALKEKNNDTVDAIISLSYT